MDAFSLSQIKIDQLADRLAAHKNLLPVPAFSDAQRASGAVKARLKKAAADFAFFDKTYFSADMYSDGYAAPNPMLRDMAAMVRKPGVHIVFGPRKHGKTVTQKKLLIWSLLSGLYDAAAVYSETIPKASNFLRDVALIIARNERIKHDFSPEFLEQNADQFTLKLNAPNVSGSLKFCAAFSEGRSLRGYTRLFGRPQIVFGDDVETLESSFNQEAVNLRINKLSEAYHSCAEKAVMLISANDFLTSCALHRVRLEYDEGLLSRDWQVYVYQAWQNNRPLWPQRFPARSENKLKKLLKPKSESDWQANFQQNPVPPEGFFFKSDNYKEYETLPPEARGVIYCDPNLAKKAKGDTTAVVALVYSHQTQLYYVADVICKSFSDAGALLDETLRMKNRLSNIQGLAFDGNVTQESTWTNFIKNWCRINRAPYPPVDFKRYRVDDIAKNCQAVFAENKILFPPGFSKSRTGQLFLGQLFGFAGKKANKADDAPDALICAFEFLHERRIVSFVKPVVKSVKDIYTQF